MKISIVIMSVLTFYLNTACGQTRTTLTGKISHPKGDKVYITTYTDYITFDTRVVDSATLNKQGEFSMTFDWPLQGPCTFAHGDEITEMYLLPGQKVHLELDTRMFDETVRYTGENTALLNYLAEKYLRNELASEFDPHELEESRFRSYMDSVRQDKMGYLDALRQETSMPSALKSGFLMWEEFNIRYDWGYELITYPLFHPMMTNKPDDWSPAPHFYHFIQSIGALDKEAMMSSSYLSFFEQYIIYKYFQERKRDTLINLDEFRETYLNQHLMGEIWEFGMTQWIHGLIAFEGKSDLGLEKIDVYLSKITNPVYRNILIDVQHMAETFQPGNPAPEFTLTDIKGKNVSLSDFRGKIVYIDVWATWCGPCIASMPKAQKLMLELNHPDLVYLFISVDSCL